MQKDHDSQYKELFSNPTLISELLRSFVHEEFVMHLDFSTLKKLNAHFVTGKFRKREADLIYQINFKGNPVYIYLLLEFQSTVDKFMSLRLLEYIVQFYKDLLKVEKRDLLPPVFPVVLYSGDNTWTAPVQFQKLIIPTSVPKKYLPDFQYYKIAVNEIPTERLYQIKNAVSAIFYVENSNPDDLAKNIQKLVDLIKAENFEVLNVFSEWLEQFHDSNSMTKTVSKIRKLTEVSTMYATALKEYGEKLEAKRDVSARQNILIDQLEIKFGHSAFDKKKILSQTTAGKLDKALQKFATAKTKDEVMKCLGG
jgi:predicted transposase/invertase (TIGR01784 family)